MLLGAFPRWSLWGREEAQGILPESHCLLLSHASPQLPLTALKRRDFLQRPSPLSTSPVVSLNFPLPQKCRPHPRSHQSVYSFSPLLGLYGLASSFQTGLPISWAERSWSEAKAVIGTHKDHPIVTLLVPTVLTETVDSRPHQQGPQEQQCPHGVCLLVQALDQESRSIELVKGP